MNPIYAITESPHRWPILAGVSFGSGMLGALMMIAFGWSHTLIRFWFWAGVLIALICLGCALFVLKSAVEATGPMNEPSASRSGGQDRETVSAMSSSRDETQRRVTDSQARV